MQIYRAYTYGATAPVP